MACILSPTIVFAAIKFPTIVPDVIDVSAFNFDGVVDAAVDHAPALPDESIALTLT